MNVTIKSNAMELIASLERRQKAWPRKALRMLVALPWRSAAEGAVASAARPEERAVMTVFLLSISAQLEAGAVRVTGELPGIIGRGAQGAETLRAIGETRGRAPAEGDRETVRRERLGVSEDALEDLRSAAGGAEDAVRQWVEAPFTGRDDPASGKDLTAEDIELGTDAVVERLLAILGLRNRRASKDGDAERESAAAGLARRIEEFVIANADPTAPKAAGVDRRRTRKILRAVLAAWRELAVAEFGGIFRRAMKG